ncbi:protein TASOR [Amia ocellicauda]|uniref:protein TASOR n=1 Tax=Amia ocellicauda TaxID=2972642 RepID=UPI003463C6DD
MASNTQGQAQKPRGGGGIRDGDVSAESYDILRHLLPDSATVPSSQDGEQAGCEEGQKLAAEQEAAERRRRRSGMSELKHDSSPSTCPRAAEELPRRNFQIPRKNKERKALFQHVSLESREFEEIQKIISSCYLDSSSVGSFTYTKASLVHSELLEKEFIEKRRELKQDGRTDKELAESYGFLLAEHSKLNMICEKGLTVGHSRITTLGKATMGVYLSKHSDLLQINPFDVGATGQIIIFKLMKGKVKSIYENMSKNVLDPTPKFDCHVSKNASRVTSLLSYRAFELTQQYFYEYTFDEIKSRPRHVCPYAVVSFVCKNKEAAPPPKPVASQRSMNKSSDGGKDKNSYTVWSGQLLNRGKPLCLACLKSATRPFLPFKLSDKLEIGTVMSLDQLKRKIPVALFYKDTYSGTREVLKNGMYCSLFEVMEKNKPGNCLASLLHKLEKENMVLVNPLTDKGFLFLLSSSQMLIPNETGGRNRCLQALFLFQEPRVVLKCASKNTAAPEPLALAGQEPVMPHLDTFIPALHYALMKQRANPSADISSGTERYAREYLRSRVEGTRKMRKYVMYEYEQRLDELRFLYSAPKKKHNLEGSLHNYLYSPNTYLLTLAQAQEIVESYQRTQEYSPVSDWEGSDSQSEACRIPVQANGSQGARLSQVMADYDQEKLEELLRLIQMRKKSLGEGGKPGEEEGEDECPSSRGLKRKMEDEAAETAYKYLRTASADNGEDHRGEEGQSPGSLSSVIKCMGGRDTDLRKQEGSSSAISDTQKLLKLLLESLSGAMAQGTNSAAAPPPEVPVGRAGLEPPEEPLYNSEKERYLSAHCDVDLRMRPRGDSPEDDGRNDLLEDQTGGSVSSLEVFSPCSSTQLEQTHHRGSEPATEGHMTWKLIPITGIKSRIENTSYCLSQNDNPCDPRMLLRQRGGDCLPPSIAHDVPPATLGDGYMEAEEEEPEELDCPPFPEQYYAPQGVDGILHDEFSGFSTEVRDLLRQENIYYSPEMDISLPDKPTTGLSHYVSSSTSPVQMQDYVSTLCEKMCYLIDSQKPSPVPAPVPVPVSTPSSVSAAAAPSPAMVAPPISPARLSSRSPQSQPPQNLPRLGTVKEVYLPNPNVQVSLKKTDVDSKAMQEVTASCGTGTKELEMLATDGKDQGPFLGDVASPAPASISNLISQLKPEVFSSLVKIIKDVQKNTVKFYIHSEEESDVCTEIKEYLMRLGNAECDPQSFLESKNNLDKLLIIIQNEDIAAHVHKIPALVSLKKLPSVSFAGVDSLDDVKNHTYNELFVSGGFVVSDDFVLNPDFITTERLQAFLKFLEEQNTPESSWQWKVHCKTQKKLKELGRLNSDALSLLTLLSVYQKKHLVEFLPYHDCDAPSRHAPDLDCLVRLQAHNTQQRHIVFLTERRFEMFPHYCNNGILIASIDDFMDSFHSLIGFSCSGEEQPAPNSGSQAPPTVKLPVKDECVEEEDMSLDSEEDTPVIEQLQPPNKGEGLEVPPLPKKEEFRPPLPEPPISEEPSFLSSQPPKLDFEALKSAISLFSGSGQKEPWSAEPKSLTAFELGGGGTPPSGGSSSSSSSSISVNTHQSFLSTGLQPSTFSSSPTFPASPAAQELEGRAVTSAIPSSQPSITARGGAACQAVWATQPPTPGTLVAAQPPSGLGSSSGVATHSGSSTSACSTSNSGSLNLNRNTAGTPTTQTGGTPTTTAVSHTPPPRAAQSASQTVNSKGSGKQGEDVCRRASAGSVSSTCGTPISQDNGPLCTALSSQGSAATPSSESSAAGTPNSQGGGTPTSASLSSQGVGKTATPGSGTPSSQGSSTPGAASAVDQGSGKPAIVGGAALSKRGSSQGGNSPHPRGNSNSRGRGGGSSPATGTANSSRGCRGGSGGGGFQSRGKAPKGQRGRGKRLRQRGTPYGWGYPPRAGGNYSEDYFWMDNYEPQVDNYFQRDGYHSHGW